MTAGPNNDRNQVDSEHPAGRRMLMVSRLPMWSLGEHKGGPALSRTLLAYGQRGWEVVFLTGDGAADQAPPGVEVVSVPSSWLKPLFRVRKIGFIARSVYWFVFLFRAARLADRLHRGHPFEVVYGYEIDGVPTAKVLSWLWRVPFVARYQGTTFGVAWSERWGRHLRAWGHWIALRMAADLIIMTDDGTQGDRVLAKLGQDMSRVRFWMNGVDKAEYADLPTRADARHRLGLDEDNVLLMVSRLEKWKCVERGINAMPPVLKEFPNTVLVIVGDGSQKDGLMRLARDLEIDQKVLFVGSIPHQDVGLYMAAADVFLSLYTWSNVGNPLLEAMLAGKCVVALANGDTPRVIENDVTGLLLDEQELELLPGVLLSLLRDPERVAGLGARARAFAMDNFLTWEQRLTNEIREVTSLLKHP